MYETILFVIYKMKLDTAIKRIKNELLPKFKNDPNALKNFMSGFLTINDNLQAYIFGQLGRNDQKKFIEYIRKYSVLTNTKVNIKDLLNYTKPKKNKSSAQSTSKAPSRRKTSSKAPSRRKTSSKAPSKAPSRRKMSRKTSSNNSYSINTTGRDKKTTKKRPTLNTRNTSTMVNNNLVYYGTTNKMSETNRHNAPLHKSNLNLLNSFGIYFGNK